MHEARTLSENQHNTQQRIWNHWAYCTGQVRNVSVTSDMLSNASDNAMIKRPAWSSAGETKACKTIKNMFWFLI